jgi:phenolic acid decarboxylase
MDIFNLLELKDIIFAMFVGGSTWYSYKLGWQRGVAYGVDESIDLLAEAGLIEVEHSDDGEVTLSKAK